MKSTDEGTGSAGFDDSKVADGVNLDALTGLGYEATA